MPATPNLPQFNAGELSPLLLGRVDLAFYQNGLMRQRNAFSAPHGPSVRRGGSLRCGDTAAGARALGRFVYAVGDANILELGDLSMRLWRVDRTRVESPPGVPVEITTPWPNTSLNLLRYAKSGDVAWYVHPDHPPQALTRTAVDSFTLADAVLLDGPYFPENGTAVTFTAGSLGAGSMSITASAATFAPTDVGRHVRMKVAASSSWTWARITAYSSPTVVTAEFALPVTSTSATAAWRLGLYSETTGYPRAIALYQERLWIAGNPVGSFPRVDGSRIGEFLTFSPTSNDGSGSPVIADDDAVQLNIVGDDVPAIRDLSTLNQLVVMTTGGSYRIAGDAVSDAITPTNVREKLISDAGGGAAAATRARNAVVYLDRHGRAAHEVAFSVEQDGLREREMSIRAQHLLQESAGARVVWAAKPWGLLLAPRADGTLAVCTYAPDQEVVSWATFDLGDDALIEDVVTVPNADGDDIWLLVNRTVGGVATRTLEMLAPLLRADQHDWDARHLDDMVTVADAPAATLTASAPSGATQTLTASASVFVAGDVNRLVRARRRNGRDAKNLPAWEVYDGQIVSQTGTACVVNWRGRAFPQVTFASGAWWRAQSSLTGLPWVDGTQVYAHADGWAAGPFTVASGSITLGVPAAVAHVGRRFTTEIQPMPIDIPTSQGGTVGKAMRMQRVRGRLVRSAGLKVKRWNGALEPMAPLRTAAQAVDLAPKLLTGDVDMQMEWPSGEAFAPHFVADESYPLALTLVSPKLDVGEAK